MSASVAAAATSSAYWRAAGMTYLKYANLCAEVVRGSLKEPFLTKARLSRLGAATAAAGFPAPAPAPLQPGLLPARMQAWSRLHWARRGRAGGCAEALLASALGLAGLFGSGRLLRLLWRRGRGPGQASWRWRPAQRVELDNCPTELSLCPPPRRPSPGTRCTSRRHRSTTARPASQVSARGMGRGAGDALPLGFPFPPRPRVRRRLPPDPPPRSYHGGDKRREVNMSCVPRGGQTPQLRTVTVQLGSGAWQRAGTCYNALGAACSAAVAGAHTDSGSSARLT